MSHSTQPRKSSKLSSILKSKGFKCLKGFKLCATGNQNRANYEIMPYTDIQQKSKQEFSQPIEVAKNVEFISSSKDFDDDFDNLVEMYYKQSLSNLVNKSANQTIEYELNKLQPSHNSTQLGHDSCCNSVYSDLSFKTTSENGLMMNKFTSTIIHKSSNNDLMVSASPSLSKINETKCDDSYDSLLESEESCQSSNNAYSNVFYHSPIKTSNKSSSGFSYQSEINSFSQNHTQANSYQFKSVTETFFDTNKDDELYVCCLSYEARDNSEVTLDFADRVKIIYEKQDMVLVQNVTNGQCGYVPIHCIISLDKFLNDLKSITKHK